MSGPPSEEPPAEEPEQEEPVTQEPEQEEPERIQHKRTTRTTEEGVTVTETEFEPIPAGVPQNG